MQHEILEVSVANHNPKKERLNIEAILAKYGYRCTYDLSQVTNANRKSIKVSISKEDGSGTFTRLSWS